MTNLKVNFENNVGKIKPMNAVNNGPKTPGRSQYRDNFETYKALHLPFARTHDASICYDYGAEHCVDVNGIFPNFDADPSNPENYDFLLTDKYLQAIIDAGTEPYYRLGTRIEHWDKKYNTLPPTDFKKWAVICEHIIAHYTEGWANGFYHKITYWEIWNEPETEDGQDPVTKNCWGGTKEEFFDFFEIAAKHLKNRFPHLKIGGPALCWEHNWGRDFVKTMSERKVPLDFYSWHLYCWQLYKFGKDAKLVRSYLDEFGYKNTESHLNEWNYVKDWREGFVDTLLDIKSEKGASFIAAAIAESQHLPIDMLMYYDARVGSAFNGLFNILTLYPQKPYYSMLYFSRLAALENETEALSDDPDIYILSASDGNKKCGMITYYTDSETPKAKSISLKISDSDNYGFYITSAAAENEKISFNNVNGVITFEMKPFSVIYFENGL